LSLFFNINAKKKKRYIISHYHYFTINRNTFIYYIKVSNELFIYIVNSFRVGSFILIISLTPQAFLML